MSTPASRRCLSVATLSLGAMLVLVLPLPGVAQDEAQPTEAPASQSLRRLYVSDKLVLNVHAEAGQSGERVATIETGDAVDEIERVDTSVHVRLQDGREGWVGANYLTDAAPAAVQLRELQRQQKSAAQGVDRKATEEIARLRKENDSLQSQVKELKATAAAPAVPADDGVLEGAASEAPQQLVATTAGGSGGPTWIWPIVLVLAAGLAYGAGYQTLARKLRRKFGGLRIY
jgi:uncharacterized protein YgiM (DUF1202 family)